ncbi:MAG: hypothetical protein R2729_20855 [Bryobacteraceae bacterium]
MRFVVVPVLALGLSLSATLTLADTLVRFGRLDDAIRLTPWNVNYRLLRATPADLEAARRIAPDRSAVWIALGLERETAGDNAAAERHLLRAASLDATFAPSWSLMNFYFRRGRSGDFWKWAAKGVRLTEGDVTGVYRLAVAEGGADAAWNRLAPFRPDAQRQFVDLALQLDPAPTAGYSAGEALARAGRAKDREALLSLCERAIAAGYPARATGVWNAMAAAGLHRLGMLDPESGRVLTNGGFREAPSGTGFDWRLPDRRGASLHPSASGLSIELTGMESGPAVLLRQVLPAIPGARYRLEGRFRAVRGSAAEGLWWRAGGVEWELGEGPREFAAPGPGSPTVVELILRRKQGRPNPEGAIVLESVTVESAGRSVLVTGLQEGKER